MHKLTSTPVPPEPTVKRPKLIAKRKRSLSVTSPVLSPVYKRSRSNTYTTNLTESSLEGSLFVEEISSNSSALATIGATPKFKGVRLVGPTYQLLKPKSKSSLYAQIIKYSPDIEHIITSWMVMYKDNATAAMEVLMRFFIDIIGNQNLDVNFTDDFNFYNLRAMLEQKMTKAQQNLNCLYRNTSTYAKTCVLALNAFLHDLISACDKCDILYESTFLETLHNFIVEMSKSKNRIVIITICSIALKILTALLEVERQFVSTKVVHKRPKQDVEKLKEVIHYLQITLLHNSTKNDNFLTILRMRSAEEFKSWIAISHDAKFCADIVKKLKKLIVDQNAIVRIAALTTCNTVLESGKLDAYITDNNLNFGSLCGVIQGRINDVHPNVEIMAIKFFTILNQTDFANEYVNSDVQTKILRELYSPKLKLAQGSAMFLATFVDKEHPILEILMQVARKFKQGDNVALLVHSIMATTPELLKLHDVMNLILKESTSTDKREWLLKLFYHFANIAIKGELCYNRDKIMIDISSIDANEYVGDILLSNFETFFHDLRSEPNTILWALKTLNIIDVIHPVFMKYREEIKEIVRCLIYILVKSDDEKILVLLIEIFSKLSDENYTFGPQHSHIFSEYVDSLIENYQNYYHITKGEPVISDDVFQLLKDGIFRLSIITEHFNIVKKLDWNIVYSEWSQGTNLEEIMNNQIKCCQHYLKWEMNNCITTNAQQVTILKHHIKQFLRSCLEIMSEPNKLAVAGFTQTCEFLLEYNKVQIHPSSKALCEKLKFSVNSKLTGKLETFLLQVVFIDTWGSLSTRMDCFQRYVCLIMNCIIPADKIYPIMKFYYLFKIEYKSIYDFIYSSYKSVGNEHWTACIFRTLLHIYTENGNAKQQFEVASHFADILPKNNCQFIIDQGLKYVNVNKDHISFIVLIKCFTKKLQRIDKAKTLQYIYDNFSTDCLENPCFNLLFNELKLKSKSLPDSVTSSERRSLTRPRTSVSYADIDDDFEDYIIEEIDG